MKRLSAEIKEHLEGEVTSLCRCWIIECNDGSKLGFTDHDQDILIEGVTCERNAGADASNVEERIGLSINSTEVSGALQSDHIHQDDIDSGFYDNARVSIYLVNWNEPTQYFLDHIYLVGNLIREDGVYRMELRGLLSQFDQTQGRHFVKRCQADLGDAQCRINLDQNDFSANGTVIATQTPLLIEVASLNEFEANWFRGGRLTWLNGQNLGKQVQIAEHTRFGSSTILQLWDAQSSNIETGDLFQIHVGCDKQFSTCQQKFSNVQNFRGFPHMPGGDIILGNASSDDTFDGGPIVL